MYYKAGLSLIQVISRLTLFLKKVVPFLPGCIALLTYFASLTYSGADEVPD